MSDDGLTANLRLTAAGVAIRGEDNMRAMRVDAARAADRIEALTAERDAEAALADQLAEDLAFEISIGPGKGFKYDSQGEHLARRSPKEPT